MSRLTGPRAALTRTLLVASGCELLKDLALSGFTDIHVIDLDTVDVSNLNRQFLFRLKDVDRPKSEVAAKFIMSRCPGVTVTHHTKPIQDFSPKWYTQFDIVIAGLDNVEARQWLNATLVNLVQFDEDGAVDPDTVIPFIDGGTEGFQGQARVFLPRITSCFECSLASMPPQTGFAVCTIRNVPRIPAHCIVYALKIEWPLLTSFTSVDEYEMADRPTEEPSAAGGPAAGDDEEMTASVPLDKDNVHHMTWLFNRASARAAKFGIRGVTYNLTMQVVKSIIPAIASTNALISAACVAEAVKFRTGCGPTLNNYLMYIGGSQTGINTETIPYRQNPECVVCAPPLFLTVDPSQTIADFIRRVESEARLDRASVLVGATHVYLASLHAQYEENLAKCVGELIDDGVTCIFNDKSQKTVKVIVKYEA